MSWAQVLTLAFFMLLSSILTGFFFAATIKYALVSGMKEGLEFYFSKKKEVIEELERRFGKTDETYH